MQISLSKIKKLIAAVRQADDKWTYWYSQCYYNARADIHAEEASEILSKRWKDLEEYVDSFE